MPRDNHRPASNQIGFNKHKGKFIINGRYKKYIAMRNKMARVSRRINRQRGR